MAKKSDNFRESVSKSYYKGRVNRTHVITKVDDDGNKYSVSKSSSFNRLGLLSIVAVILIIASLFSVLTSSSEKTFYSLLVMLQNVPDVLPADSIIAFFSFDNFVLNLPNWLEWIAPLLNVVSSLLTVLAFIVKGCLSALTLAFYFLRWLFV